MEKAKIILDKLNSYRKQRLSNKSFIIIASVVVGAISGVAASLLKLLTHKIEIFLQQDTNWSYKQYFYLFFPLIGILLSVFYVKRFLRRRKFETGLTQVLYSISRKSSRLDFHNIYSQIVTTALTVGFGGSTGLEAPIATSGSAIGSNVGRALGLGYREVTLLLACGAAAAIAGAFNSPLAGIVFAIEILLPEFSIPLFIPLLMASATAAVVARLFYQEQLFYLSTEGWVLKALFFYIVLAVITGFFSIYFTRLSYQVKRKFDSIKNVYGRALSGGLVLGALIFLFPILYGEGYVSIKQLLLGNYDVLIANSVFSDYTGAGPWAIIIFVLFSLFAKSFATLITLSSGGNGGIFGPSIIMGALGGFIFAFSVNQTGLTTLSVPNFMVAGMAAAISGIMHAPLTGIFLIAEITGGYTLMVPLMIVSSVSYFISKAIQKHSIYTKGLADKGDLLSLEDKDRVVLSMMKLKYLVESNFVVLHLNNTLAERRDEILQSRRNIFPVTDYDNVFLGVVYSHQLFDLLIKQDTDVHIEELMQSTSEVVTINDSMPSVMAKMNNDDVWILPVIDENGKYLGFISKSAVFNKYRALLKRQANLFN